MHTYRVLTAANGFINQTHHTCHTHQRACLHHSELACHKRCPRSHIQHAPWALCRFGWHKPWYWAALTRYFTWNATTTQNIRTENKHCTASVHRTKSNAQNLLIYCLPRTNPWIWSESASCTWRYLHTAWSTHLSLENWSKYMAKVSTLICLGHLLGGPSTLIENEPTHVFSFMIYGPYDHDVGQPPDPSKSSGYIQKACVWRSPESREIWSHQKSQRQRKEASAFVQTSASLSRKVMHMSKWFKFELKSLRYDLNVPNHLNDLCWTNTCPFYIVKYYLN